MEIAKRRTEENGGELKGGESELYSRTAAAEVTAVGGGKMVSMSTWCRYVVNKFDFALSLASKRYVGTTITYSEFSDFVWKNVFQGKLTYMHWNKGEEMAPSIGGKGGTLLVRKLPISEPTHVFVGDVVVLKDPEQRDDCIIRRLAAIEGYEMVSKDPEDEPFVLDKGQCWVLADNETMKPEEASDSRKFGPLPMTDIMGRVIYCLRTAVDHGPVQNSLRKDMPVLEFELDVEEMAKNQKQA